MRQNVYSEFLTRLNASVDKLESCILIAQNELKDKNIDSESLNDRVDSYLQIVGKQRSLINRLSNDLEVENWEGVTQTIKSVNAMSTMIRDDARAILKAASREGHDTLLDDSDEIFHA